MIAFIPGETKGEHPTGAGSDFRTWQEFDIRMANNIVQSGKTAMMRHIMLLYGSFSTGLIGRKCLRNRQVGRIHPGLAEVRGLTGQTVCNILRGARHKLGVRGTPLKGCWWVQGSRFASLYDVTRFKTIMQGSAHFHDN
jgi:hypothetical protein